MQYFAQDEATRLEPTRRSTRTLEAGSSIQMVPAIRTILGGFLFGGDDIYKKAGVLSGGARTRLAVARMLLRPANTLLLDEPTNHLDMDSKDVLLDALEDFGGTLILVSHDRYFIDKLATKVIDVGGGRRASTRAVTRNTGGAWRSARRRPRRRRPRPAKAAPAQARPPSPRWSPNRPRPRPRRPGHPAPGTGAAPGSPAPAKPVDSRDDRKRQEAEERRRKRAREAVEGRIAALEATIAEREGTMKTLEATMSAPGFYENHDTSKPTLEQHQTLMWELGDLMHRWEELQQELEAAGR